MNPIVQRLTKLRSVMKENNIMAIIVPGTDPHANEYIPNYWKEREFISGFNGSAGTAVVLLDKAGLWTDSRYFLQAEEQLRGTGFDLMKQGMPETPDIVSWVRAELKANDKVGINPQMVSFNMYASMKSELQSYDISLCPIDLLAEVWNDRPQLSGEPFFVFDVKYAGKSAKEKFAELRKEMKHHRADVCLLSGLDDIAWLFNIRGNDIVYNPLVIAYALVDNEKAVLFVDKKKVTKENETYLKDLDVEIAPYESIYDAIAQISSTKTVLADGNKLNQSLYEAIPKGCAICNTMSPVFKMKSIKNDVEVTGVRNAMIKDGVALTRFLKWMEEEVGKSKLTEISVSEKLHNFRSQQALFFGESFATIAGYESHGAIVHYSATPQTDSAIRAEGILLLDSGGQYFDGTTDITRTVSLGSPSIQQKNDFTLVLKGHINLATAVFPIGTRGSQLDVLARKALWDRGLNYGHGTGHGVGHFLNVHEGPQNIRIDENPTILKSGMIISNEPGLYRTSEYGMRIENLILVVEGEKTEFGEFLQFETLTLFPIDSRLINVDLLDDVEMKWLNNYHATVFKTLSPYLNKGESQWLEKKCMPIYAIK